jgi:hypothetical protein
MERQGRFTIGSIGQWSGLGDSFLPGTPIPELNSPNGLVVEWLTEVKVAPVPVFVGHNTQVSDFTSHCGTSPVVL